MIKATNKELDRLFATHGLAPLEAEGSDSAQASRGGRIAAAFFERRSDLSAALTASVGDHRVQSDLPSDLEDARKIVASLKRQGAIPSDASFENMVADLLLRASALFDESGASSLELAPVHLHPSSYHIGGAVLLHDKPLHTKERLSHDAHDRHAVFNHRHGDSTEFPK